MKDFLAFMLVILLALAIFGPSAKDTQTMATVYPATSSVSMAVEQRDVSYESRQMTRQPESGRTLNSDVKVLVQVVLLVGIGMLVSAAVRRWRYA